MDNRNRRLFNVFYTLLIAVIMMALLLISPEKGVRAASFSDLNQSNVFIKQSKSDTCTLAAAAMMVRRAAIAAGNSDWSRITESAMRKTAWLEGTGLYWNFCYAGITVNHGTLSGGSKNTNQLIALLSSHPEGIVIYNGGHAVLLTDYTNGIFYCADPSNGVAAGRIPAASASITISSANSYWYVSSGTNIDGAKPETSGQENIDKSDKKRSTDSAAKIPVKVSAIKLTGISNKIAAGKKLRLSASALPENASNKKLVWSTSNKKIATVTQKGVVTIKKKTGGKSVIITAAAKDGSGKKALWKIKVMKGVVKKLTVKGAKTTLKPGKTLKLKATVKATKGANRELRWTSGNTKYATVNAKGVVKALKDGKGKTVKITVTATDGSNVKKVVKVKIR